MKKYCSSSYNLNYYIAIKCIILYRNSKEDQVRSIGFYMRYTWLSLLHMYLKLKFNCTGCRLFPTVKVGLMLTKWTTLLETAMDLEFNMALTGSEYNNTTHLHAHALCGIIKEIHEAMFADQSRRWPCTYLFKRKGM